MPRGKRRKAFAKRGKRGRRGGWGKKRAGGGALGGATHALASLQSYRSELATQRAQLEAQIQVVDQALRVMGGAPARAYAPAKRGGPRRGRAGRRGPRPGSLKEFILKVIGVGQIMSVKDITKGVLASGYKTKNKTLAKSVGIALTELPNVTKVGRGKFRGR